MSKPRNASRDASRSGRGLGSSGVFVMAESLSIKDAPRRPSNASTNSRRKGIGNKEYQRPARSEFQFEPDRLVIGHRLFKFDDPAVGRPRVAFEDDLIDNAKIVVGILRAVREQIGRVWLVRRKAASHDLPDSD